ncbi:sensor histidine kinase [Aquiflexum gelatinilyticum]|uniref:Oxygen sensor histidine kinase NreB n=1 Tax=Aquiflexum gelatinilyticum TaxID=2961943 RepID=A0A9X2P1S9_9BACT|nr:sensor histidine kinase [Aquiflexum gelatinilyticum]MCR9014079.1 sensor histidine kinase [Aquiflexum gelatinilyticum]MCS4433226.1 sensor histidine kinase [Aquiflexum gelatinilyticum]
MAKAKKGSSDVIHLLDNLSGGILLLDNIGEIIYINKTAAFFLGIDPISSRGLDFNTLKINGLIYNLVEEFKRDFLPSCTELQIEIDQNLFWIEVKIHSQEEALILYLRNITKRKEVEEKYKASYESIRNLNSHSQKIREDERSLLSREIHDQLGQRLTGMKMEVEYILKKSNHLDDFAKEKLQVILKQIERTVGTIRNISRNLRPGILDDFGILAALEWQADEFTKSAGIPVFFKYKGEERSMENQKATAVFRIFQECMTNIMRHSKSTHVNVEVVFDSESIMITIIDDGAGFDQEILKNTKSLGILGMRERTESFGGNFNIQSAPGKGTTTILTIPY